MFTHTDTYIYICAPFHLYTIWTACVLILDTHGYVCTCNDNKLLHSYIWMSVWMSKNIYIYIDNYLYIYIYTHPIPYSIWTIFMCLLSTHDNVGTCNDDKELHTYFSVYLCIYISLSLSVSFFHFIYIHMCICKFIFKLHKSPYLYHLKLHLCVCTVDTHDYICTCNENKMPHSSIATNFRWPFNRPFVTLGVLTLDIRFTSVDFYMHDHGHLSRIGEQYFMFC